MGNGSSDGCSILFRCLWTGPFRHTCEADRIREWKRKQLPTEAQFHRAAYARTATSSTHIPGETRALTESTETLISTVGIPCSGDGDSSRDSYYGVAQLVGNGWEWTSTLFEPFHGFEPLPGYEGYSANFFDGHHYVLKGASPRTASAFLRRSFRNWFRPNYPYVYAGFRCIEC